MSVVTKNGNVRFRKKAALAKRARGGDYFEKAMTYYRRVRGRLYKNPKYRDKYIVIRDDQVVEVDADKFALYKRALEHYPDHRFIMMPVWREFPTVSIGG